MALIETASIDGFFFERKALRAAARERRDAYRNAHPYPHAVFDGFLGEAFARRLAAAFPGVDHPGWLRREYAQQLRLGQLQRTGFAGVDPAIRHLLAELGSMAFLDFLTELSGAEGLIADPHFGGAGLSLTARGGYLALHADFNRDRRRHLERRLTVLYYLTADWDPAWGGELELWDKDRTECVRHPPLLDRLIVMDHGDEYWHGHPVPLACPPDRARAAVLSYYYVAAPPAAEGDAHGAIWVES